MVCGRRSKADRTVALGLGPGGRVMCPGTSVRPFRGVRMAGVSASNNQDQSPRGPSRDGAGGVKISGGEFDPGSGSTLAACLMHASRTGLPSGGSRGGRVRNTWAICPAVGASRRKRRVIPHGVPDRVGSGIKDASRVAVGGACVRLARRWGDGLPWR